jgi:hypothetical protein
MQPLFSLDLTLLQHVSASRGHPQVFHFLPKLLAAFTISQVTVLAKSEISEDGLLRPKHVVKVNKVVAL